MNFFKRLFESKEVKAERLKKEAEARWRAEEIRQAEEAEGRRLTLEAEKQHLTRETERRRALEAEARRRNEVARKEMVARDAKVKRMHLEKALAYGLGQKEMDEAAAYLAGTLGRDALPMLVVELKSNREWPERAKAARLLGRLGNASVVETLIEAMEKREEHVSQCAAEALGDLGDPRAIAALIAALEHPETNGAPPPNAESIFADWSDRWGFGKYGADYALAKIGSPAVEPLLAALNSESNRVRWSAVSALGRIGDKRAIDPIFKLLPSIPGIASKALTALGWKPETPEHRVRWAIAHKRYHDAALEGALAVQPLIGELRRSSIPQRPEWRPDRRSGYNELAHSLFKLAKSGACPLEVLVSELSTGGLSGRDHVAWILGALGNPRAVEPLSSALNDPSQSQDLNANLFQKVRITIVEALEDVGGDRVNAPLFEVVFDPNPDVRSAARKALDRLKWKPGNSSERALHAILHCRLEDAVAEGSAAVEPLVKSISSRPTSQFDGEVGALARIGDVRAVEPLVGILTSRPRDVYVTTPIIRALGDLGGSKSVETLVAILNEHDWYAYHAAEALEKLRWQPATAEQRVLYALARGKTDEAASEGPVAIVPLVEFLKKSRIFGDRGGIGAVSALLKIGEEGTSALRLLLQDKNEGIQAYVADHLCGIDAGLVGSSLRALVEEVCQRSQQAEVKWQRDREELEEDRRRMASCSHDWYSLGPYVGFRCRKCGKGKEYMD